MCALSDRLVVGLIRQRRYQWLGHLLRLEGPRLVKEAVKVQFQMGLPGNILMDVPPELTFEEIVTLAQDRKAWKAGMPKLRQRRLANKNCSGQSGRGFFKIYWSRNNSLTLRAGDIDLHILPRSG